MDPLQAISGRLQRGEIEGARYLEELLRFVTGHIGCTRAGLRLFVDGQDERILRPIALYDAVADRMVTGADIRTLDGSAWLDRLRRDGSVAVNDVASDPVLEGALRHHLQTSGVRSTMDMACSVNGSLFGAFCCEQLGAPVDWSQRQLQALRRIASRASLTLVNLVQTSIDTTPGALWETSIPNRLATLPMPLDRLTDR